jgi:predicted CXXCH cytochrome family protein
MSKLKVSISTLLMLLVLSMYSIAALAAAPGAPILNYKYVGDDKIVVTWGAVTDAVSYNVYWNGGTAENQSTLIYEKTGLNKTSKYTVAVEAVNAGGEKSAKTTFTIGPVSAEANNAILNSVDQDNNIDNANQSGSGVTTNDGTTVNQVIKSTPKADVPGDRTLDSHGEENGHRTHGEYQNNTNSCASCHQTHTASSKSLLFKNGVYATCTACHDGTLGFYNVFNESGAGTFGGTHDGNMSVHLANGTVKNSAAPGGNRTSTSSVSWGAEFNCASCHAPHGSYSDRLLHYSPNGMGRVPTTEGGLQLVDVPVVKVTTAQTATNILLVKTLSADDVKADAAYEGETAGATVVQMMKKISDGVYENDTTPWLYGYDGKPKVYWTFLTSGLTKVDYENANVTFKFGKGYVVSKDETGATLLSDASKGTISRAYVVKYAEGELVENATLSAKLGIPVYDSKHQGRLSATSGKDSSAFCSACHTDYFAKSGTATGTWNQAYRHTTNNGSYNCMLCHFAHGTDVSVMSDAQGHKVADLTKPKASGGEFEWPLDQAEDYMRDKSPSSALKRFTGMSVCWACHTSSKASQLKNNDEFQNATGHDVPHGLPPVTP